MGYVVKWNYLHDWDFFSFKVNYFLESNGKDPVRPKTEALLSLTHPRDELDTSTNIFWEKRFPQL